CRNHLCSLKRTIINIHGVVLVISVLENKLERNNSMGNITDLESLNEYYRQLDKEKLQITLTMASPLLIPKHFLHFDAILTDLVARRFFGHENERWYDFSLHKE